MHHAPKKILPLGFIGKSLVTGLLVACAVTGKSADFAKGADVGWLSQMESRDVHFYNSQDIRQDCLQVLQSCGMNSIRLRVWVNPKEGWCGQADVVKLAVRAKDRGFRIMIDFHYSDWWADPGKQNKPAAWKKHDINQLVIDVASHTTAVLTALKGAGVTPEWVQVGNETNDGMLWPEGKASKSMANFAALINSGYAAVKSVFPDAKVIVHISNGYNSAMFRWIFDGLTAHGAKYDVIGMSLYPELNEGRELVQKCFANMNDMVSRYGKEVMLTEVGIEADDESRAKAFLSDIIAKTKSVKDGKGLGVLYWEPECHNNWEGYTKGAFRKNGRPGAALEAFK